MPPSPKSKFEAEAFKLYLVGGIALVLAALWWLRPGQPAEPLPMGRLEQAYREEITALFGQQAANACQYWAKHLYITCGTVNVSQPKLRERGWQVESSTEQSASYLRAQWRLKLRCAASSKESCAAEIWFVRGATQ